MDNEPITDPFPPRDPLFPFVFTAAELRYMVFPDEPAPQRRRRQERRAA
jgi:hypothetical protein